ncbi:MAG: alpha 1,2 mannosyltransferase, partial [Pleopsidium flavum]
PFSLLSLLLFGTLTTLLAIIIDTAFYTSTSPTLSTLLHTPTITPLNNILYNTQPSNLALHGLHPYYQHTLINLPLLLGPVLLLLLTHPLPTLRLFSALSGTILLSLFPHQEPRFLLPAIPLLVSSIRLPRSRKLQRWWFGSWIIFNACLGVLMGTYHQGGVIPTQLWLGGREDVRDVLWWKTYSPPIWMLDGNGNGVNTTDLMGMKAENMIEEVGVVVRCGSEGTYLVAPRSSEFLDRYTGSREEGDGKASTDLRFKEVWTYKKHLNLDDLDFAEDGVWATVERVVGRRGLTVWKVTRECP